MFSYFGSKTNVINLYPRPKFGVIIEPFAGSARYALRYFENDVILIDKYPVIVKIWKWLQKCSKQDILKLPSRLKQGEFLSNYAFDCEEARLFMGFVVGSGLEKPRNKVPSIKVTNRPNHVNYNLQRIAANLFKIKHWQIIEGEYTTAPRIPATWFVDPPYRVGGESYVMSNRHIDYQALGEWCMGLPGQVIVCENDKARWLPFVPIGKYKGTKKWSTECVWMNEANPYSVQSTMFESVALDS